MHEILSQIFDEVRSAYRFRWYGLLVAWAICLGGWGWVALQPNVYEANARVYVDTSSVLQPVLGNRIVAPNMTTQLAYIREALLGHDQLEAVAQQTGLDRNVTTSEDLETVIARLQQAVRIQLARGPRNSPDGVYSISYRSSDRERAIEVVDSLLDTFVESTHGVNQQQGDTAERFLDDRVDEYEARLAQAEEARAKFTKENAERLPGNQGGYFARLQSEREALDEAKRQLAILQSKRDALAKQLHGEDAVVPDPSVVGAGPAPNSIDARIQEYERRLDTLLLDYTDKHPDVIRTREALERLREQKAQQLAALGVDPGDAQDSLQLESNPVYQALQVAINDTDVQIASLNADISLRQKRVDDLQGLIDEVPEVEAQLARLNRDYEVVYEQYLALVRSRETQDLTRQAMDTDQIDFRIIDPPLASSNPVAPDRLLLLTGVFVVALAVAGGLCYLLAQFRPVFHSGNALRLKTGLPLLGVVSNAWPEQVKSRRIRSIIGYATASSVLLIAFAGLAAIEVLGPGLNRVLGAFTL